jgi:dTDP-4-dehydrorhamnose reductase
MKIIVLGSNGMLGRYVSTYFKLQGFEVIDITRKELNVLFLREEELRAKLFFLNMEEGDIVINCIGMIKQRKDINDLEFIYINSMFPRILANVCESSKINLIHPTTDCVWDGLSGLYNENDSHNATDVYGKTKSLGEPENATVIRTSIIGEEVGNSRSLVEWVKSNKDKKINGYTNHFWNGVTCLQFAKICEDIIVNNKFWNGVKHLFSNTVDKYELTKMISDTYELNIIIEPFETPILCDRSLSSVHKTDINIPELKVQIKEMKEFNSILIKNNN